MLFSIIIYAFRCNFTEFDAFFEKNRFYGFRPNHSCLSQSTNFWQFINVSYKDSVVVWPSVDGRPVCGAPEFEFAHWLAVATIFCFRVSCFFVCVDCALFYLVLFNVLPLTPAYAPPSRRRSNDGRIRYFRNAQLVVFWLVLTNVSYYF